MIDWKGKIWASKGYWVRKEYIKWFSVHTLLLFCEVHKIERGYHLFKLYSILWPKILQGEQATSTQPLNFDKISEVVIRFCSFFCYLFFLTEVRMIDQLSNNLYQLRTSSSTSIASTTVYFFFSTSDTMFRVL